MDPPAYQPHLAAHAGLDLDVAMLNSAFPSPSNARKPPLAATLANRNPPVPKTDPQSSGFHFHSTALMVERAHSETMATVPNISVFGGYTDSMSRNNSADDSPLSASHSPTASTLRRRSLDGGSGANADFAANALAHGLNKIEEQDPESSMNGINQTSLRSLDVPKGEALQDALRRMAGEEFPIADPERDFKPVAPTGTDQDAMSGPVASPASTALPQNKNSALADQFSGSVPSTELHAGHQENPAHPVVEVEELAHPAVQAGMMPESSVASDSSLVSDLRRPSRVASSAASQFPPLPTREAREAKSVRWRVELLCPDGSSLLCSTGVQILGRGMVRERDQHKHSHLWGGTSTMCFAKADSTNKDKCCDCENSVICPNTSISILFVVRGERWICCRHNKRMQGGGGTTKCESE